MSSTTLSRTPEPVALVPQRQLGLMSLPCVVEEKTTDDLEITSHPVEQGAAVTDHAYKKPAEITLTAFWSNSGPQSTGDNYVSEVFDQLLQLQESREPLDVITGKRAYGNMLIKSISQTTDQSTEHALSTTISLKQIIIVETQATTLPPRSRQRNPARNGGTEDKGQKQPQQAESGLSTLFG